MGPGLRSDAYVDPSKPPEGYERRESAYCCRRCGVAIPFDLDLTKRHTEWHDQLEARLDGR